jgi:DNA-binding transcriptional ArsR family regulator
MSSRLSPDIRSVSLAEHARFVYHTNVNASADTAVSPIAAAIGEPARARMLYCLADGRARTSTELSVVAGVSPSTASVHLSRLMARRLVTVVVQGKHRYYTLGGPDVAAALEALSVLAGGSHDTFVPSAPSGLRAARTCYDHMAGAVAVSLHDRLIALKWLSAGSAADRGYDLTVDGATAVQALGIDLAATRALRRRFAFPCVDWSERRPHVGGALGAALLTIALKRRWVVQDVNTRILTVTAAGRRDMRTRFGVVLSAMPL